MAQIQHAQRADVPVEYVMGIGGFDLERVDEEVSILKQSCLHCGGLSCAVTHLVE